MEEKEEEKGEEGRKEEAMRHCVLCSITFCLIQFPG